MTDEEFERLATLYGFAPSKPLREMLEAAVKAEREKQGMTHEDIIRMAKASWGDHHEIFWFDDGGIERFAALVRADEREACAQILDRNADVCANNLMIRDVLEGNAAAIRARAQK